MRKIFTLLLLLVASCCFSQRKGNIMSLGADNYQIKGICNGVRLDTLSCHFITVIAQVNNDEILNTGMYKIDYGQGTTDNLYNDLRDENQHYIQFNSFTVLLNFMNYNGWIYQNNIINQKIYTAYANKTESSEVEKLIFIKKISREKPL